MIFKLTERDLKAKFGDFREILYYDWQAEPIAILQVDTLSQEAVGINNILD
jgi:hypothetical protein